MSKCNLWTEKEHDRLGIVNPKWELRFMEMADLQVAQWSKDRSSKVGCVLVNAREIVTTGYHGLPRDSNDDVPERH